MVGEYQVNQIVAKNIQISKDDSLLFLSYDTMASFDSINFVDRRRWSYNSPTSLISELSEFLPRLTFDGTDEQSLLSYVTIDGKYLFVNNKLNVYVFVIDK